MAQLQTVRLALSKTGAIWGTGHSACDLVSELIASGGIDDPLIRDEAAKLYIEGEIMRLLAYRSLSDRMNAKPAGPEAAVRKMVAAPHGQRIVDLAKRVQGMSGLITGNGAFEPTNGGRHMFAAWDYGYWFNPALPLRFGTP